MIISSKPDYTFEDDGINFRIFYVEDKIIVKAKCLPYMVIQYGNKLSTAVEQAKNRLQNMKAPPK